LAPKSLSSAVVFVEQLNFAVVDSTYCAKQERYELVPELYGKIHRVVPGDGEVFLNPSDKAVVWFSNHEFLAGLVNDRSSCCHSGEELTEAMTQCMCRVASAVEMARIDGEYQIAAMDATVAEVTPIQPKWMSQHFQQAFVDSYAWVFGNVTLAVPLAILQSTCRPSVATWSALESFNRASSPGLDAYFAIMNDATYGVRTGSQMHELKCSVTLDAANGSGGCTCLGSKGGKPHCHTHTDVALFCGSGGVDNCDPRPFLCPAEVLPVGYVRAYLHKFFDAIPYFHGTGFADKAGLVPEFVVYPNMRADSIGVARTAAQTLFSSCL